MVAAEEEGVVSVAMGAVGGSDRSIPACCLLQIALFVCDRFFFPANIKKYSLWVRWICNFWAQI